MNELLGIYIHIPFCASHCSYCHFVIDLARGEAQQRYTEALIKEIEQWGNRRPSSPDKFVDTLYVGGGTPSWIPASSIERILQTLRRTFHFARNVEATIEVNPDSIDEEKIARYREAGINRVSVGVQSFHDAELKQLGRTHTADDAERAIGQLRGGGFNNISIDLLAGLPGQNLPRWRERFCRVATLHPEHVSLYLFDLDEESTLGRKVLHHGDPSKIRTSQNPLRILPDEDELKRIYDFSVSELNRMGYDQYEISNFARRDGPPDSSTRALRSRHNLKYWNMQPYLGLGCAAHSYIPPYRWRNENSTESYVQSLLGGNDPRRDIEEIDPARLAEDAFIFGLRQTEGVDYPALSNLLGRDARSMFRQVIDPLMEEGWLIEQKDTLRLAPKSILVSNEIFERFLNAKES